MVQLKTNYAGLTLDNPVIAASSGLTGSIDSIKKIAEQQPGAIVLKSLFEEQIVVDAQAGVQANEYDYPESADYIRNYSRSHSIAKYLEMVESAKKFSAVPVIASINCVSGSEWTAFAKNIENTGADALELNISVLPSNPNIAADEIEKRYFDILQKVSEKVRIPVTLKMSNSSSSLAALILKLDWTGFIKGFVLFNRHYCPDIDIANMKLTAAPVFSSLTDYPETLRWVAMMSGKLRNDIAATTGIHDGKTAVKFILAGAKAVQVASIMYKKGPAVISEIKNDISDWMESKEFKSIDDFRGRLSMDKTTNPEVFERIQFMKYFATIE
jgi:dihydroorotate dehydrogenase (fumarate)